MKTTIIIIAFLVASTSYAQFDKNTKAKLYFQEAQRQFNQNEFKDALNYLEKTKNSLGSTNGRIISLKIKTLYNLGRFLEAEKALNIFANNYSESVTDDLKAETLSYFIRIENAANAQREAQRIKKEAQRIKKEIIANSPEMIKVVGGTFTMGYEDVSDFIFTVDVKTIAHEVTLSSYYIGKTEVTVAQYRFYCKATGVSMPEYPFSSDNSPIIKVTWQMAMAYCKWLSDELDKTITLPTEAQWEFAARGGNQSNGYMYSGSNTLGTVGWYDENSKAHRVAQKKANELGLYDMSGNVWEWCLDWYDEDYYSNSPNKNPKNTKRGKYRVLRGGSWIDGASFCRVASRFSYEPGNRGYYDGFRVVSF